MAGGRHCPSTLRGRRFRRVSQHSEGDSSQAYRDRLPVRYSARRSAVVARERRRDHRDTHHRDCYESSGVKVIESRLTRLAYAAEIAQAMLRRQQASAVVAARQRIVEGAVGMVEQALDQLAAHDVVDLDEERKAAMVSNLLVVLCSDHNTHPLSNTGGPYP